MANEREIIDLCLKAALEASRDQWRRDGFQDRGTCGGMMLGYRANTRFARAMVAAGVGYVSDGKVWLLHCIAPEVRSQNMDVEIRAKRAFRDMARSHGIEPAKQWTYID
jgi:predicted GNAT superfamily acetyltransferase